MALYKELFLYHKKKAKNILHFHREMFSLPFWGKRRTLLASCAFSIFPSLIKIVLLKKIIHCLLISIKNKTKANTH